MKVKGELFLNRYRADHLIGEGGMGQVFLGRQLDNNREVVIKVMHQRFANDPKFRKAFEREMVLMTRFRHPYAVNLYEAALGETDRPCIVMEFVRGITLAQMIEQYGRLPVYKTAKYLGQLCQVLQAAHDNGIIHRDLTPVNVMIMDPDGPDEQVKVMDFGLARMGIGPYIPLEKLTGQNVGIGGGTPDYVSPEQIRKEDVDHRADLYSLGVLLYKSLTGYLPFEHATTTPEILQAHVDMPPPPFRAYGINDDVPVQVEQVVQSCLVKFPHERLQSALEVADRFGEAIGERLIDGEPIRADLSPFAEEIEPRDPRTERGEIEAFMPEPIAVLKLRGFAHDMGGEITDSEPGMIRVRLQDPLSVCKSSSGLLSLFGVQKKNVDQSQFVILDLRLEKKSQQAQNLLVIRVKMIPSNRGHLDHAGWQQWADGLYRELRAYLISR